MTQLPAPVPAPRTSLAARLANTERAPIPAPDHPAPTAQLASTSPPAPTSPPAFTAQPASTAQPAPVPPPPAPVAEIMPPPPPPPPASGPATESAPVSPAPPAAASTELDSSDRAWAAAAAAPVHRLWPPTSYRLLTVAIAFVGVWGFIGSLAAGSYLAALIFLAMLGWAVTAFGFVELSPGQVKHVKLLASGSATADDVDRIDLVCRKRKNTKWWFPVVTLADGSELPVTVLRSVRKKRVVSQAKVIQAALDGTAFDDSDETGTANSARRGTGGPGDIPDDVFTPLEGLKHHYSKVV